MGPLREIVDIETVGRLFALLALVCPLLGACIGALVGLKRKTVRQSALVGLLLGMFGPLNWLLWRLYTLLTDANGLDTVRNLFLNLAVFLAIGTAIGFSIGWIRLRVAGQTTLEGNRTDPPQ